MCYPQNKREHTGINPARLLLAALIASLVLLTPLLNACGNGNGIGGLINPPEPPKPDILNTNLTPLISGHNVVVQLGAFGGMPPYKWQVVAGNLPDGLSLDESSGRISGVPSTIGSSQMTFLLTDSTGTQATSVNTRWNVQADLSLGLDSNPNSQSQADYRAWQNSMTAMVTQSKQLAQHDEQAWGVTWQWGPAPAYTHIDCIGLAGATNINNYPVPYFKNGQYFAMMPNVQGYDLKLPWTFTVVGLPKSLTYDSSSGLIQGSLSGVPDGKIKVDVFFKDAGKNSASFTFQIPVGTPPPPPVSQGVDYSGGKGALSVSCVSNGELYVNGGYIGKGSRSVSLMPGDYTVTCVDANTGKTLWQKSGSIEAGKTWRIVVN